VIVSLPHSAGCEVLCSLEKDFRSLSLSLRKERAVHGTGFYSLAMASLVGCNRWSVESTPTYRLSLLLPVVVPREDQAFRPSVWGRYDSVWPSRYSRTILTLWGGFRYHLASDRRSLPRPLTLDVLSVRPGVACWSPGDANYIARIVPQELNPSATTT